MKIIIVGDGKVGLALMESLAVEDHDIVMVDNDASRLQRSQDAFDIMTVQGNGASMQVLEEAGAADADLLIAVTSADELNLLCCITARHMGCPNTIARVRNLEYSRQLHFLRDELGLSMTINPEASAAREIFHLLQFPSFINRDTFAKGRVEIVELRIPNGSPAVGKNLIELYQDAKIKVLVCAIERDGEIFIPSGSFVLQEGDKIHVTAQVQNLSALVRYLRIPTQKIRDVVILGGSRIAQTLAQMLLSSGVRVKIIEQDYNRCVQLSALLGSRAMIINADAGEKRTLAEELVGKADAVVSLLGIDEVNLMICTYASKAGIPKVVAKVDRIEYMDVYRALDVDSIISPKQLTCNRILRYVRAMCNPTQGSIITLYRLLNNRVEALEFRVTADTKYLGVSLRDAPIQASVLLACIRRGNSIIFPTGNDQLLENDSVIVVTTTEKRIINLNDIFAK